MAFASGGVLNQPAMTSEQLSKAGEAARAAAAALASKPGSRKSKFALPPTLPWLPDDPKGVHARPVVLAQVGLRRRRSRGETAARMRSAF